MFTELLRNKKVLLIGLIIILLIVGLGVFLVVRNRIKTPVVEGFTSIENWEVTEANPYPWLTPTQYRITFIDKNGKTLTGSFSSDIVSLNGEQTSPKINIGTIPLSLLDITSTPIIANIKIERRLGGTSAATNTISDITPRIVNILKQDGPEGSYTFIDTDNPWTPPATEVPFVNTSGTYYVWINDYVPTDTCATTLYRTAIWDLSLTGTSNGAICEKSPFLADGTTIKPKPVTITKVGYSPPIYANSDIYKTVTNTNIQNDWKKVQSERSGWFYTISYTDNVTNSTKYLTQNNETLRLYSLQKNDITYRQQIQFYIKKIKHPVTGQDVYTFINKYIPLDAWTTPVPVVTACFSGNDADGMMFLVPRKITSVASTTTPTTYSYTYTTSQCWRITPSTITGNDFANLIKPPVPFGFTLGEKRTYYISLTPDPTNDRQIQGGCGTVYKNQQYYVAMDLSRYYGLQAGNPLSSVYHWSYLSLDPNWATPITITYVGYDAKLNKHNFEFTYTSMYTNNYGNTTQLDKLYFIGQAATGATVIGGYPMQLYSNFNNPTTGYAKWQIEPMGSSVPGNTDCIISLQQSADTTSFGQGWGFCRQGPQNSTDTSVTKIDNINRTWTGMNVVPYGLSGSIDVMLSKGTLWRFSQIINFNAATPTNPSWSVPNLNLY